MGVLEIISGVLLILCSVAIIILVLFQDTKGSGLSALTGGDMMANEGRSRSTNSLLAKYTKYAAIVFFVVAVLVGVISIYLK